MASNRIRAWRVTGRAADAVRGSRSIEAWPDRPREPARRPGQRPCAAGRAAEASAGELPTQAVQRHRKPVGCQAQGRTRASRPRLGRRSTVPPSPHRPCSAGAHPRTQQVPGPWARRPPGPAIAPPAGVRSLDNAHWKAVVASGKAVVPGSRLIHSGASRRRPGRVTLGTGLGASAGRCEPRRNRRVKVACEPCEWRPIARREGAGSASRDERDGPDAEPAGGTTTRSSAGRAGFLFPEDRGDDR